MCERTARILVSPVFPSADDPEKRLGSWLVGDFKQLDAAQALSSALHRNAKQSQAIPPSPAMYMKLPRLTIALIGLHHLGIVIVVGPPFVGRGSVACRWLRKPVG